MFKVGDRVEYTGLNDSLYFTNGRVYEVVGEGGPDMWYITDNEGMDSNDGRGHAWPKRDFHESFRLVGPVRTETVTKRRIVPGVYGRLKVRQVREVGDYNKLEVPTELAVEVAIMPWGHGCEPHFYDLNAEELDSLAMVASQLAEALRDVD